MWDNPSAMLEAPVSNKPERARVAFIGGRGYGSHYSGLERAVTGIARRLVDRGWKITVYGHGAVSGAWTRGAQDGVETLAVPRVVPTLLGNAGAASLAAVDALFRGRFDLVVLFASGPALLSGVFFLAGRSSIAALRALDSRREKWGPVAKMILRWGEAAAFRFADAGAVNSREMERYFAARGRQPIYIPNGADFPGAGSDSSIAAFGVEPERYLLFASRLVPEKRADLLVAAYRQVAGRLGIPLVIAGGGVGGSRYSDTLQQQASSQVRFVGHLEPEQLDPLLRQARLFVLPSTVEGMSNSLLSAMAAGRCCLTSDIPANAEVVEDPELLFPVDDRTALAARLLELGLDPARAAAKGQALALKAVRFGWEEVIDRYDALFAQVLKLPVAKKAVLDVAGTGHPLSGAPRG